MRVNVLRYCCFIRNDDIIMTVLFFVFGRTAVTAWLMCQPMKNVFFYFDFGVNIADMRWAARNFGFIRQMWTVNTKGTW